MPFYFAWCGGAPIPPFTLQTKGDVWGGKWQTTGSTWGGLLSTAGDLFGTGVWSANAPNITNLQSVDGLTVGETYIVSGISGISPNTLVQFTYQGNNSGRITPAITPAENLSFTLESEINLDVVVLDDTSFLEVGVEYGIEGSGISSGTTFIFEGSPTITISHPATTSASSQLLTITNPLGRNVVKNLADTTGLIVGQTYSVFSVGLSNNVLGVFQSDGTLLLSQDASSSAKQTFLNIHRGTIYPDGGPFDPDVYARKDEFLLSIELEHNEGHFPSLKIGIKNPRIGLLAPGRNVWCWLSWSPTAIDPIVPLFHGRLTAIPSDILKERVTLSFVAEPGDYEQQRNVLTETLKVPPNYDALWFADGNGTPDTILEGYTRDWHTDRTTLEVSTSDILVGEDGILEVAVNEHISADLDITISNKVSSAVYVTAAAKWNQKAIGTVDITRPIVDAFGRSGSRGHFPIVQSYSGDGLVASWPKQGGSMGQGGWTVGFGTGAFIANLPATGLINSFSSQMPLNTTSGSFGFASEFGSTANPWLFWSALYPLWSVNISLIADYQASRGWQEIVSFFIESDIQAVASDASVEVISLSTDLLDQPIDPDGGIPLFDPRTNTFFKTDRGAEAFQFLLHYGIAKLAFTARSVAITFSTRFHKVALAGLSCRWNAVVTDPRIPGGQASGKVTSYKLLASASGGMRAIVTIGCTIGHGGVPTSPVAGVGTYAAPGYMAPGYQVTSGATVGLPGGELTYQSFDDFTIKDDGVNFFDMTANNVVKSVNVVAGVNQQNVAISTIRNEVDNPLPSLEGIPGNFLPPTPPPDPTAALQNAYTRVRLEMVSVDGSGYETQYVVGISPLQLPKTIDLEAPSA